MFEGGNGKRELGHGVQVARAAVNELLDKLGDIGPCCPFCRQLTDLLLAGDFSRQQ